jgi:parallel beta-helix repeat protein
VMTGNYVGIEVYNSSSNSIIGNSIIANTAYGILLGYSFNNGFYHNNIINNSQQVSFSPFGYADIWDDGYPIGGNYWSDYNGTDANHDGIGDTPYVIDMNNTDNYPLMNPWYPILGDINFDGKVSLADLVLLAKAYSSKPTDSNWNANADIDGNGIVGLSDLVILAQHYGQHNA